MDYGVQTELSQQQPRSQTPSFIPKLSGTLGTTLLAATEQPLESTIRTVPEGALMAEGLPEEANAIGAEENDRDRVTLINGHSLRVHRAFAAKS